MSTNLKVTQLKTVLVCLSRNISTKKSTLKGTKDNFVSFRFILSFVLKNSSGNFQLKNKEPLCSVEYNLIWINWNALKEFFFQFVLIYSKLKRIYDWNPTIASLTQTKQVWKTFFFEVKNFWKPKIWKYKEQRMVHLLNC